MIKSSTRARALVSITAVALLLLSVPAFAGKGAAREPQRVVSVALNGDVASFKLADGSGLEVPAALVRVNEIQDREEASADGARAPRKTQSAEGARHRRMRMTVADLATLSQSDPDGIPAIVQLKYDRDGMIKRARVMLFASDNDASAFLDRNAKHRAEIKAAAKPKD